MIASTEKLQSWLQQFEQFDRPDRGPAWLRSRRREAFTRFWELGFPTIHDEDWRFTSVQPIANTAFQLAPAAPDVLTTYPFDGAACQIVFVNGRFAVALSSVSALPSNVTVRSLADVLTSDGDEVEPHLARHEDFKHDAFTALNTAFIHDGAYVRIPRGVVLEQPIHILYISAGADTPLMSHPRNLIVVDENAQAEIVEDYVSLGSGTFFSNVVTELIVGENSVVSHYMIEREDRQALNVSTLHIRQNRAANVSSHSVLLGGALVRNNVHPVLAGEGGECLINGLFMGAGRQHMDNYMKVEHQAPHCGSRQFYNGILDEHARGVFHGRIIVHKGAQKTDAKQTNRNLLLSDDAQIDTKPQLEIYADDVKCTHGATIGQIDESALFYLRSRGLPEADARALLLFAFANESLDRMKPGPVRHWLESLIAASLPQGATPRSGAAREITWQEVG
ncbi:MAG: Fe-S cluster assembly protein SufD [Terriglobales bacterium]